MKQRCNLLPKIPNTHIHTHSRTIPTTKILIIVQATKICKRFNKMSTYIKVYFCFATFFCKRPDSKYLRFFRQYDLSQLVNSSLQYESSHTQAPKIVWWGSKNLYSQKQAARHIQHGERGLCILELYPCMESSVKQCTLAKI